MLNKQYDKILKDVIKSAKKRNMRNLSYKSKAREMADIAVEVANIGRNKYNKKSPKRKSPKRKSPKRKSPKRKSPNKKSMIVLSPRRNARKRRRSSESITRMLERMNLKNNSSSNIISPKKKKYRS
jgi:hypothetical protein